MKVVGNVGFRRLIRSSRSTAVLRLVSSATIISVCVLFFEVLIIIRCFNVLSNKNNVGCLLMR